MILTAINSAELLALPPAQRSPLFSSRLFLVLFFSSLSFLSCFFFCISSIVLNIFLSALSLFLSCGQAEPFKTGSSPHLHTLSSSISLWRSFWNIPILFHPLFAPVPLSTHSNFPCFFPRDPTILAPKIWGGKSLPIL